VSASQCASGACDFAQPALELEASLGLSLARPRALVAELGDQAFHQGETLLNLFDLQPLIGAVTAKYPARLSKRLFELSAFDLEVFFERVESLLAVRDVGLHLADAARRGDDE